MTFILADRRHPLRPRLEDAVQNMFAAEYGARVPLFPEHLIARLDAAGLVEAVAGLRFESDGFFSETYLDDPVEKIVARNFGVPAERREIVEFSSLAAVCPGSALPLLQAAIRVALASGARFALFTATARLRALLRRRGVKAADLAPADAARLKDASPWGRYYLHDPRVLLVSAQSLPEDCLARWSDAARGISRHA